MDRECRECGSTEWSHILSNEKTGHKGGRHRDTTKVEKWLCEGCGTEGKKFTDGITGDVQHTGALR